MILEVPANVQYDKMKESSECALRNHVEFPALSVRGTPKAVAG